ncbi:unnamed protein product [Effrenium voratum]|nr:unnamed protein product [Effrenium voratum]
MGGRDCFARCPRYKEPWVPTHAASSLSNFSIYEASANAAWLNPFGGEMQEGHRYVDDPAWQQVVKLAERFVEQVPSGQILWPFPVHAYFGDGSVPTDTFPQTMYVISGQQLLFGYWLRMYQAVTDGDASQIGKLWRTGLSLTVTAHAGSSLKDIILASLAAADDYSQADDLADQFPLWARKVAHLLDGHPKKSQGDQLAFLSSLKLRFKGTLVGKSHLVAVNAMKRFNEEAHSLLSRISKQFGKEVLCDGYGKLVRISQLASQLPTSVVESSIVFLLEAAFVALARKECDAGFFVLKALDNRAESAGWITVQLQKSLLVAHLLQVARSSPDGAKLEQTMAAVTSPLSYHEAYPLDEPDQAAPAGVGELTEKQKRWFDLGRSIIEGEYDEDLARLCFKSNIVEVMHSKDQEAELLSELHAALTGLSDTRIVAAGSACAAPGMSVRQLARLSSNPEDVESKARERAEIWRQAQNLRKKLISFTVASKESDFSGLWDRSCAETVRAFNGAMSQPKGHRLFVASCDLHEDGQLSPWSTVSSAQDTQRLKSTLRFLVSTATKNSDFVLAFDGRSAQNRRLLEDELQTLQNPSTSTELWIAFVTTHLSRPGRRVFGAAAHRESGYLKGNVARVRLNIKKREDPFVPDNSGEVTSYEGGFVGVELPAITSLPRIAESQKPTALNIKELRGGAKPRGWERSQELWAAVLSYTDAGCIVDATAGSGSLAVEAFKSNLPYMGICKSQAHLTWITNRVDIACIRLLADSSHPLYQQALGELISEEFEDELRQGEDPEALTEAEVQALSGEDTVTP